MSGNKGRENVLGIYVVVYTDKQVSFPRGLLCGEAHTYVFFSFFFQKRPKRYFD